MTGGMAPALVPIMGAVSAETCSNRCPKDHLAWSRTKSISEASFVDKLNARLKSLQGGNRTRKIKYPF